MKLWPVLALLPGLAGAQEFVTAPGPLDDEAFYRAVACAAAPGQNCRKPFLYWPEARRGALTVALASVTDDLKPWQRDLYERGLDNAVAQINALNVGVRLSRSDRPADIEVHIVATPPGHVMRDTGVPDLDGALLPLGRVALRARGGEIREALIAVSALARRREIGSILLEEIVQSLGLMTDIRGPAFRRSLFSEDGNSVVRLRGQDAMALRRHYDPARARADAATHTDSDTPEDAEEG